MKKKIVLAGTLKPVDDVRAFEKIAQSIAKTNKYEINIIGNSGKKESEVPTIRFISHRLDRKSLVKRYFIRFSFFAKLIKIKPDLVIITTHELLAAAVVFKIFWNAKLIYDVQEDYRKNLKYLGSGGILRKWMGSIIRIKESILSPLVDEYWLAESTYLDDLRFTKNKSQVFENKAVDVGHRTEAIENIQVLFSGTISHYSQILLAVDAFKKLKAIRNELSFLIIGQCHDDALRKELMKLSKEDHSIKLIMAREPVSHELILLEIFRSSLGIISYQENEVNKRKLPTKLFEYSRYHLPYLIQKGTFWEKKSSELGGAIPVNFNAFEAVKVAQKLDDIQNTFPKTYPFAETWESHEELIQQSIATLLH